MKRQKPIISAIAAMTEHRVIGKGNKMPWHLPADLKHFKTITNGHQVLMGRKTYESIGNPLPNRTNIILTRDHKYSAPDCIILNDAESAVSLATELDMDEIFVIGGAEIYRQLMPQIQRVYLTIVHHDFEGDAFFPELKMDEWQEISRERNTADEKNKFDYSFVVMERV